MVKNILYSFVLPAYKALFFRESITSILNQTYRNFELIIVNDCSPEDLNAIVKEFQDERIKYYANEENIGGKDLVAQWNHCLEYGKGEYIILASDDDVYDKDFLLEVNQLAEKYPEADLIRARVQRINEQGEINEADLPNAEKVSQLEFYFIQRNTIQCVGNYVFKRSPLIAHGGFIHFDLAWFSDTATSFREAQNGICITDKILFSFRASSYNISQNDSKKYSEKKAEMVYKYYKWFENFDFNPTNRYETILVSKIKNSVQYVCLSDLEMMSHTKNFHLFLSIIRIKNRIKKINFRRYLCYFYRYLREL